MKVNLQKRKILLSGLLGAPSIRSYLKNNETNILLIEWMTQVGGEEIAIRLKFCSVVEEYTKLSSRALLASRGTHIFEKYLSEHRQFPSPVSDIIIEDIRSKVLLDVYPIHLFWDAYNAVLQSLEAYFSEFLKSDEFRALKLELLKTEKQLDVHGKLAVSIGTDVLYDRDCTHVVDRESLSEMHYYEESDAVEDDIYNSHNIYDNRIRTNASPHEHYAIRSHEGFKSL